MSQGQRDTNLLLGSCIRLNRDDGRQRSDFGSEPGSTTLTRDNGDSW